MKVFIEKLTSVTYEATTKQACCDRMAMALRNHDVKLVYDNNKKAFGSIQKWNTDDQILCTIQFCPWCGEKIEMEK